VFKAEANRKRLALLEKVGANGLPGFYSCERANDGEKALKKAITHLNSALHL